MMDLGEVQTRRAACGAKTGSSVCTSEPSSLLSNLPFVPYLDGNRLERNRLVLAPARRADSQVRSFRLGYRAQIPAEKFAKVRKKSP